MSQQAVAGSPPREENRPLRVAVVVHNFPSLSETFILSQVTGLLERGHEVDIFETNPRMDKSAHPDVARFGLLQRTRNVVVPHNLLARAVKAIGLLVAHAPRHPLLLRTMNVARYGRAAISLRVLHTAAPFLTPYDIVHCQYGTNGEAVGALLKELGLQHRLVTTFHRFDIRLAERPGAKPFRRLLAQGDCFIAISGSNRRLLLAMGVDPAKVVSLPVGIDCRVFRNTAQPSIVIGRDIRVVTVARLAPQKGLHHGILAISRLMRNNPDLRLRYEIVGGGPLHEDLTALIGHLGLGGVVRLHGPLKQDAVIDVLRRSHVFLLPSIDEVTPVSLMEALAVGLPVIATAVGSNEEIVAEGRSGFLVPMGDVEALAAKLQLLIDQPQLRAALGEFGGHYVLAHRDVNVLNDRLVEIYRHVLGGNLPIDNSNAAWKTEASTSGAFTAGTSVKGQT
jgi:colanic acid/amylovoran biosynthesis glycosyltransferase